MALTDDARKEISAAIAIIREDRFEKYVRSRQVKPADSPTDPPAKPEGGPTPPPVKPGDPPVDPPADPPKKAHPYWGEIFED